MSNESETGCQMIDRVRGHTFDDDHESMKILFKRLVLVVHRQFPKIWKRPSSQKECKNFLVRI